MAVLKVKVNVALAAVLIVFTVLVKLAMTRVLRVRFEHDDLLEAKIICGNGENSELGLTDDSASEEETAQALPTSSRIWKTWKNMVFDYGTSHAVVRRKSKRQSNPFSRPVSPIDGRAGDGKHNDQQSPETASKAPRDVGPISPEEKLPFDTRPKSPPAVIRRLSLASERRNSTAITRQNSLANRITREDTQASRPLVNVHPSVPAWDDEPDPDHSYDNPYYSAPIGSSLWLPRNPCGILDLDDTVDMHMSLTTVETAGELGLWHTPSTVPSSQPPSSQPIVFPLTTSPEQEEAPTPPPTNSPPSGSIRAQSSLLLQPVRNFSGTESISLPPRIEARTHDPAEYDEELENALLKRPSGFRRRSSRGSIGSTSYFAGHGNGLYRPNTIDAGRIRDRRGSALSQPPTSSSLLGLRRKARAMSTGAHVDMPPDGSAQAAFTRASMLELGIPPAAQSRLTVGSAVTAHEAVQAEVIAEEREVADTHLREEAEEAIRSTRHRGWWQRWAFATPKTAE
jgi:hypothetical protein